MSAPCWRLRAPVPVLPLPELTAAYLRATASEARFLAEHAEQGLSAEQGHSLEYLLLLGGLKPAVLICLSYGTSQLRCKAVDAVWRQAAAAAPQLELEEIRHDARVAGTRECFHGMWVLANRTHPEYGCVRRALLLPRDEDVPFAEVGVALGYPVLGHVLAGGAEGGAVAAGKRVEEATGEEDAGEEGGESGDPIAVVDYLVDGAPGFEYMVSVERDARLCIGHYLAAHAIAQRAGVRLEFVMDGSVLPLALLERIHSASDAQATVLVRSLADAMRVVGCGTCSTDMERIPA